MTIPEAQFRPAYQLALAFDHEWALCWRAHLRARHLPDSASPIPTAHELLEVVFARPEGVPLGARPPLEQLVPWVAADEAMEGFCNFIVGFTPPQGDMQWTVDTNGGVCLHVGYHCAHHGTREVCPAGCPGFYPVLVAGSGMGVQRLHPDRAVGLRHVERLWRMYCAIGQPTDAAWAELLEHVTPAEVGDEVVLLNLNVDLRPPHERPPTEPFEGSSLALVPGLSAERLCFVHDALRDAVGGNGALFVAGEPDAEALRLHVEGRVPRWCRRFATEAARRACENLRERPGATLADYVAVRQVREGALHEAWCLVQEMARKHGVRDERDDEERQGT